MRYDIRSIRVRCAGDKLHDTKNQSYLWLRQASAFPGELSGTLEPCNLAVMLADYESIGREFFSAELLTIDCGRRELTASKASLSEFDPYVVRRARCGSKKI